MPGAEGHAPHGTTHSKLLGASLGENGQTKTAVKMVAGATPRRTGDRETYLNIAQDTSAGGGTGSRRSGPGGGVLPESAAAEKRNGVFLLGAI